MKDDLISLLETFKYPVLLQGSLAPNEPYPESFFTFWNTETNGQAFYDNDAHAFAWLFTIYFYSTDAALVNSVLLETRSLLTENNWIVRGKGYDVPTDEISHTGRAIDVLYLEREETINA